MRKCVENSKPEPTLGSSPLGTGRTSPQGSESLIRNEESGFSLWRLLMDHFPVSGYDNLGHPISGVGREAGNELHTRHRRLHHEG